jgi:hypothetical protein
MEKGVIQLLDNPAKHITEFTDKSKKGHHITYQKKITEAKPSE